MDKEQFEAVYDKYINNQMRSRLISRLNDKSKIFFIVSDTSAYDKFMLESLKKTGKGVKNGKRRIRTIKITGREL